ncbi:type IV pilin protein [Candidatus Avelusimicrobium luingense]|uniref:type IV pilin protein n=1 Tax=Candidatus Avelusimicrobium luingense TaxID=3416211 RepID=UPI003D0FFFFF
MKNNKAFTLIELLVVVLIIGILAAVAVPQYQKAVEKSKAVQAMTLLKTLGEAGQVYKMANGNYPETLADFDIEIPSWTGTDKVYTAYPEVHSTQDWNILFNQTSDKQIRMERLTGKYRGAGFQYQWEGLPGHSEEEIPLDTVFCIEYAAGFQLAAGSYCEKIFKGTKTSYNGSSRVYKLP